jgi:cell division protein FtsL
MLVEVWLTMFDSLDEQIKRDEKGQSSTREKVLLYLTISAVSVLIFGGLIIAVQHLQ